MKKVDFKSLIKFLIISIFFTSCSKEEPNLISVLNNNIADAAFHHINSIVDIELGYFEDNSDLNGLNSFLIKEHDTCPDITLSFSNDSSYIDSLWIDYGEEGCEWKGRTKTGKILITQNGKRNQTGTITRVELINLIIDDYAILGTQIIERSEVEINSGNWVGTDHVQVNDAIIKNNKQLSEFIWNSDRVRQGNIENGELIFCIEGNMNGINSEGFKYTITTRTPLKHKLYCPRIISGVLNVFDESGINPQTIDYGNGTCDLEAIISTEYNNFEVSLW
tara:strand:- start:19154 stop:19987 length:834 start_codon:yes stop_codon:yes gene_type:complete